MNIIEYTQMRDMIPAHRYKKSQTAVEICKEFGLMHVYNTVMRDSALQNNPYHNAYHTHCMVVNAHEAVTWYNRSKDPEQHIISKQQHAELLIACLYHDLGHSMGKFSDTTNVALAVTAARGGNEEGQLYCVSSTLGADLHIDTICNIIAVTEYPFIRTPKTLCEQIIRDCDLLQSLEPDWMEMIFVGLFKELKNKPEFADMTIEQFGPLQIKFLENAEFFTEWFEKTKRKQWKEAIKNVKRAMQ